MVAYTSNHNTQMREKEKSGAQGHPQLHSKLKANLGVMANFSVNVTTSGIK